MPSRMPIRPLAGNLGPSRMRCFVFKLPGCLLLAFAIGCGIRHGHPHEAAPAPVRSSTPGGFLVTSPAFEHGGLLPVEFTGDGDGISPPLEWKEVPEGTRCFALSVWHVPGPGTEKSYWVVYNIPSSIRSLPKAATGIGSPGYNDHKKSDYMPMKSKGPGMKEYHLTLYALSAEPAFTHEHVTRVDLLRSIKDITLAESTLSWKYQR